MGLTLTGYALLAITGSALFYTRLRPEQSRPAGLRLFHIGIGVGVVGLVVVLLAIGILGTLGEYGHLGHSVHLPLGLTVAALVATSAWSASRISVERPWARRLHLVLNGALGLALAGAGLSGWQVVQKYLP